MTFQMWDRNWAGVHLYFQMEITWMIGIDVTVFEIDIKIAIFVKKLNQIEIKILCN